MKTLPKSPAPWRARYVPALLAVTILVLTAAAPAEAGQFAIGFDATYTNVDSDLAEDEEWGGSVRASYFFNDRFELEVQYLNATADPSDVLGGLDLSAYFLNGIFNFRTATDFVPYLLVGAGRADAWICTGLFQGGLDDTGTAYHVAVGGRKYFGSSRSFALRLELALMSTDLFDESLRHTTASAGLTWRFGN